MFCCDYLIKKRVQRICQKECKNESYRINDSNRPKFLILFPIDKMRRNCPHPAQQKQNGVNGIQIPDKIDCFPQILPRHSILVEISQTLSRFPFANSEIANDLILAPLTA